MKAEAAAPTALLGAFDFQARWCREPAPFTSRVLQRTRLWLEQDEAAHAAFAALSTDPMAGAVPLRWAGALHHLALRGLQPWAGLWPPAVSEVTEATEAMDAALDGALQAAWREQQLALQPALALPPQTNEVMRSAALLPGLLHVAARTGRPLVLLEIGSSAGLNLWCDRYRHDHGSWQWGDPNAALTLSSAWQGFVPVEASAHMQIVRRAGCDASPIDLQQPDEGLRLASFIWPEQAERLQRLHIASTEAARWLAQEGVAVEAQAAADFVTRELRAPQRGCATVLMHSVVWQYIAAAEQIAITQQMEAAGARATEDSPLAWLRFEPPAADAKVELRCRIWPGGDDRLLARCHPHAARIEWVAPA